MARGECATFKITIRRGDGERWPVTAEATRPPSLFPVREDGELVLSLTELAARRSVAEYGRYLGEALFADELKRFFLETLGASGDELRVLLAVEDRHLEAVHWQRLMAPGSGGGFGHLALDQRTPLSRHLPSTAERSFPAIGRRDLRALVVVADPAAMVADAATLARWKLAPLGDVRALVEGVRGALGEIPCDVWGDAPERPPTLDALCERLTAERYTLLHVVAHGRFIPGDGSRPGESVIYLEDAAPRDPGNRVRPVTASQLVASLERLRRLPYLAFFATCESAAPDEDAALAQRLVRDLGLPAVVAMTEKVSMETAQALAATFYRRLREVGEVDRALVEATAGLADRQLDITVPALFTRFAGEPLTSDDLDRDLSGDDVRFGLDRLRALCEERAPILLPRLERRGATLAGYLGTAGEALSRDGRGERDEAMAEVDGLAEEVLDMSFQALALGHEPPAYDARCPFRGGRPFGPDDADLYPGHPALSADLVDRASYGGFLALVGPSGCGKSSLALAGLAPALGRREPELGVAVWIPDRDPSRELEAELAGHPARPLLLVVDQLERLFLRCDDGLEHRHVLKRLAELPAAGGVRVLVTLRDTFAGACRVAPAFGELLAAHSEVLEPPAGDELRRAVERQAGAVGLRVDPVLDALAADAEGEPGAPAGLQGALEELWRRRHGRWLRPEEYRASGGVAAFHAAAANAVWAAAADLERPVLRDLLLRLVRLDGSAAAGGPPRDAPRPARLAELAPADASPDVVRRLLASLADARVVVTRASAGRAAGGRAAGGDEVAELAHGSLIRCWPRLISWLADGREALLARQKLAEEAAAWNAEPLDERLVRRGQQLSEVEEQVGQSGLRLNALERTYLTRCAARRRAEEDAEKERHRRELEAAHRLAAESEARRRAEEERAEEVRARAEERVAAAASLRLRAFFLFVVGGLALFAAAVAFFFLLAAVVNDSSRTASQLAARALVLKDTRLDLATLLAVESQRLGSASELEEKTAVLAVATHDPTLLRLQLGNARGITDLAWSGDGRTLATAGRDHRIAFWDAATFRRIARFGQPKEGRPGHRHYVTCLAWSPDGSRLAAGDAGGLVIVWDAARREALRALSGHTGPVAAVAWSAGGAALASAAADGSLRLWDPESGEQRSSLEGFGREVRALAVSDGAGGQLLAAAGEAPGGASTVRLFDAAGAPRGSLPVPAAGTVLRLAFRPGSRVLAAAGRDMPAVLFDAGSGRSRRLDLPASPGPESPGPRWVTSLAWSRDGRSLAAGTAGGRIVLWTFPGGASEIDGEAAVRVLRGHDGPVAGLAFSRDGRTLASGGGSDRNLVLWRPGAAGPLLGRPLAGEAHHKEDVRAVGWSGDGRTIASGGDEGVIVWEPAAGEPAAGTSRRLGGFAGEVESLAFRPPAGNVLAAGATDGTIRLWERQPSGDDPGAAATWELRPHLTTASAVTGLAWSRDGSRLAVGGADGRVTLWDAEARRQDGELLAGHGRPVRALAFEPEGEELAAAGDDSLVVLWDVAGRRELWSRRAHDGLGVGALTWIDDDGILDLDVLVSGGGDGQIAFWDEDDGAPNGEPLAAHRAPLAGLAISPDGSWLASLGAGEAILLWDVDSRKPIGKLSGDAAASAGIAWQGGQEGPAALVSGAGRQVMLWEADMSVWIRRACARVYRELTAKEWEDLAWRTGLSLPTCAPYWERPEDEEASASD